MQVYYEGGYKAYYKVKWYHKDLLSEPTKLNESYTAHLNIQDKLLAGQATLCTHYPAPPPASLFCRAKAMYADKPNG